MFFLLEWPYDMLASDLENLNIIMKPQLLKIYFLKEVQEII